MCHRYFPIGTCKHIQARIKRGGGGGGGGPGGPGPLPFFDTVQIVPSNY